MFFRGLDFDALGVDFNVSVKEMNKQILFLRKLTSGGSEHSFGIHVAKVAGMPNKIVSDAEEMLVQLENKSSDSGVKSAVVKKEKLSTILPEK